METKDIIIVALFAIASLMFIVSKPLELAAYERGAERRSSGRKTKNAQLVSKGINVIMNVMYAAAMVSIVAWIWFGLGK